MSKGIVLLAAGGTGGHVFPAEALAHTLKARGYQVHLVTDSRAERYAGKFPADEIHVVPSATIGSKNPISVAGSLWKLWVGLRAARRLVAKLKPVAVVGFGGYPTVPPLLASTGLGVPSIIHEQNAVMGRANKALAGRVKAIAGGFLPPANGQYSEKTVATGYTVVALSKSGQYGSVPHDPSRKNLEAIAAELLAGRTRCVIDRVFPFAEAGAAVAAMASHRARGQIVVHVAE